MKRAVLILLLMLAGPFALVLAIVALTVLAQPTMEDLRRESQSTTLAEAVCRMDMYTGPTVPMVFEFIDKGADVNQRVPDDPHPPIPLIEKATRCGHVDIVQLLIRRGANVDEAGLREAVLRSHEMMARMLVDEGASLRPLQSREHPEIGPDLLQPAVLGAQLWLIERLLDEGADVQTISPHGEGLLVLALKTAYLDDTDMAILRRLLEAGAHVNALTDRERQPLVFAANRNSTEAIELLLAHGADIDASMPNGWLDESIATDTERKVTALAIAAENCQVEIVEMLVRRGAAKPPTDPSGEPATHVCNRSADAKPEARSRILALLTG